jgi:hypothetical protein
MGPWVLSRGGMGAGMVSSEAPARGRSPSTIRAERSPSGRCDVPTTAGRCVRCRLARYPVAPESSHVSARRRRGGCGSRTGLSVTVPHAPTAYAWERPFSNTGVSGCNQPSSFFTVRGTVRGGALGPSTSRAMAATQGAPGASLVSLVTASLRNDRHLHVRDEARTPEEGETPRVRSDEISSRPPRAFRGRGRR